MVVSESDRVFLLEVLDGQRRLVHEVRYDPRGRDSGLKLTYRGKNTVGEVLYVRQRLHHWDEEGTPLPNRPIRKSFMLLDPAVSEIGAVQQTA